MVVILIGCSISSPTTRGRQRSKEFLSWHLQDRAHRRSPREVSNDRMHIIYEWYSRRGGTPYNIVYYLGNQREFWRQMVIVFYGLKNWHFLTSSNSHLQLWCKSLWICSHFDQSFEISKDKIFIEIWMEILNFGSNVQYLKSKTTIS